MNLKRNSRRKRIAFVLLEVTLAMVILSVAMIAVLRGFMIALSGIRENAIIEKSSLLAETLMHEYQLEPPDTGRADGRFADDDRFGEDFDEYRWEREVEEERVRYDGFPTDPLREEKPLYEMTLRIIYEDEKRDRVFIPVTISTYLVEPETFSQNALQQNQLFR